ncbi:hypothetical protein [Radiobacillus sp. PE A8.2]|uniref:hypothetical protein n=1 Tax=Radiobacillus sp. PE A8.2 TaxID=3380349 RepID=UPI00388D8543
MRFDPNEDYLEDLRHEGPDPEDYSNSSGQIDWNDFNQDYDSCADEIGFPN